MGPLVCALKGLALVIQWISIQALRSIARVSLVECLRRWVQFSMASVAVRTTGSCLAPILKCISDVGQAWAVPPWRAEAMFVRILQATVRGVPRVAEP